jgi:periplasmic protein CpxP/Spy
MSHPPSAQAFHRHAGGMLAAALLGAAALVTLPAQAMPGEHGGGHGMHGMHGMQGMHSTHGGHGGGMAMGMMGHPRMVERMLDSVNATSEQRGQVRQLVEAAQKDLAGQRDAGRALRDQTMSLFTQPTVDARAVETLRQQMLAQHDNASKRTAQLMIDISRVLTPEQRRQLAERMAQRRQMMERHRHERQQIERPTS